MHKALILLKHAVNLDEFQMLEYDIEFDRFIYTDLRDQSLKKTTQIKRYEYSRYIINTPVSKKNLIRELKKSPVELCIEITDHCNFFCPICIANAGTANQSFLSTERFSQVLAQSQNLVKRVCITGGEPLLHPEIEKFLSTATKSYPTVLSTNGYLSERVQRLSRKYQNIIFAISIHGTKNIHDKFVNFNSSFEHALESVQSALKNKALVHVYTVATNQNIHSIPELVDLLEEFPIKLHKINVVKKKGRLNAELNTNALQKIVAKCEKSNISKLQFNSFPYYLLNSDGKLEVVNGYGR